MISTGIFLMLIAVTSAYKTGPPVGDHPDICQHMIPSHGVESKKLADSPINMTFSQTCFGPQRTIKVEVSTTKDTIEGFFIQARTQANFINATSSYGKFRTYTKHTGLYDCFSGKNNAVGHKVDEPKVKKLNIYWQAPATGLTMDIHIGGTVVLHKEEFWVNVYKTLQFMANCEQKPTGEDEEKAAAESGATVRSASGLLMLCIYALVKFL